MKKTMKNMHKCTCDVYGDNNVYVLWKYIYILYNRLYILVRTVYIHTCVYSALLLSYCEKINDVNTIAW